MHSFIHSMTYVKCEEFLSVLSPFGSVIGCDSSLLLSYLRILFPWFLKGKKNPTFMYRSKFQYSPIIFCSDFLYGYTHTHQSSPTCSLLTRLLFLHYLAEG